MVRPSTRKFSHWRDAHLDVQAKHKKSKPEEPKAQNPSLSAAESTSSEEAEPKPAGSLEAIKEKVAFTMLGTPSPPLIPVNSKHHPEKPSNLTTLGRSQPSLRTTLTKFAMLRTSASARYPS